MKLNKSLRIAIFLFLILANFSCDQVSKSIVRKKIEQHTTIKIIGNNFILTKVENTGAFLGMGSKFNPAIRDFLFLWFPALLILLAIIWVFLKKDINISLLIALSFIIGGGFGNIFDRIIYGSVTDFFHIDLGIFKTGIFNLADVSVMIGMVILLIDNFRLKRKKHNTA